MNSPEVTNYRLLSSQKKICKADLGQEVLFNEMHVCSRNKINDAGFILFILLLTGFFCILP